MEAYAISFDNTETAFAYKTDKELKKARILFEAMRISPLVRLGTRLTPWAINAGLPVKGLIRHTIFAQFVGGETLQETAFVADKLQKYNVQVILDYGVEGKESEDDFERSCEQFIRVIGYASARSNMPFVSIKVTGFARFSLLAKLDAAAAGRSGYTGRIHTEVLNNEELAEWQRVVERMERIVESAAGTQTSILVDAEESWIQDPVDALTTQMMEKYNRVRPVVFNTIQLYRKDRLAYLKESLEEAQKKNYRPGVKLVRGAYMEKERKRAEAMNYPSPIQPDKKTCDRDYNAALEFCLDHIGGVFVIVASHNEHSNLYATELMKRKGLAAGDERVHFSQLYGMSDHITFNLAAAGYRVSKYLPFGPLRDVIPYLMRRAEENSSVSGQTGRELLLIRKELRRRG